MVLMLGRLPSAEEILYMTAGAEYWGYVDSSTTPTNPALRIREVGQEGLARNYYEACGADAGSSCSPNGLYRFTRGYQPWSGIVERGDGSALGRASHLITTLNSDFFGTGDRLWSDVDDMVGPRAQERGWTGGMWADRPWQWFGPTSSVLTSFGLNNAQAILSVDLGLDKNGVRQYFYMFTAQQDFNFGP
jgi:hypothetical protein